MASRIPPHRVRLPLVRQEWRDVTFLHWPVEPSALAGLVPDGLALDTHDGAAWVTVSPFSTTCAVFGAVPVTGPRRFPETNVRTYVRGPDGHGGIWFLDLEVTNRANAVLGVAGGLPYHLSDMSVERPVPMALPAEKVRYRGTPRDPARVGGYDITVAPTDADADGAFDVFVTGRWSAYVRTGPALVRWNVAHAPWPLRHAEVVACDEHLLAGVGVSRPSDAPVAHYASGVSARLAPVGVRVGAVGAGVGSHAR